MNIILISCLNVNSLSSKELRNMTLPWMRYNWSIDLVRYQYKRQQQEYVFTREHFSLNAKFAAALWKNDRIHYQSRYQLQKLVTSILIVKTILTLVAVWLGTESACWILAIILYTCINEAWCLCVMTVPVSPHATWINL